MSTTIDRPDTPVSLSPTSELNRSSAGGMGKVATIFFIIVAAVVGGYALMKQFTTGAGPVHDYVLHTLKPQDVDILVVERGSLESAKNVDLMCEIEAKSPQSPATTILSIIKEGSEVKKGDLLVELDAASINDQIIQQKIKVEQARASLTKADTELEITKSQNVSDIKTAEIALQLAEIDVRKYLEGDYQQERRNIDGEIVIAEEEMKRAQDRLDYSERLAKKDYVSASEVEADRLAVTKAKNSLDVAKEKLRVLDEYTKPRQETDLVSKKEEAQRKLDRVRSEAKAKEAQAGSAQLAQKLTTETEESILRKLEKQIEKCKLYAPADGMVVYANDPMQGMRGGQTQVQIEEGASLRERQKIIRLPDLESMQVNVKVHEAKVSHIRNGLSAKVKVESLPDRLFEGTVTQVATTADSQSWFSSGVQVYTVMVSLSGAVEGLKPGMTAEVEIAAEHMSSVLAVPVQSLVEREGQSYCYVVESPGGTPQLRRINVGQSNDKVVVVEKGLNAGDQIVDNIAAVLSEKENEKRLSDTAKADAEKYKDEKPKPVVKAKAATGNDAAGPGAGAQQAATKGGQRGAGGGAGGGGGGMMPTSGADWIKQNDKNGDGKVAKDEMNEDGLRFWDYLDTNKDGFIDLAEADAMIAKRKQMMQQQQQGGGAPGAGPGAGAGGGAQ